MSLPEWTMAVAVDAEFAVDTHDFNTEGAAPSILRAVCDPSLGRDRLVTVGEAVDALMQRWSGDAPGAATLLLNHFGTEQA